MKSPNFSINVVLVGLCSVFEVCFGWKSIGENAQTAIFVQSRSYSHRRRELRLREELCLSEGVFT